AVWFSGFLRESGLAFEIPAPIAGLGVAVVGLLMVSPIPYRSFKDVRLHGSFGSLVLVVVALVVLLTKPSVTFFLAGMAYVASGPIEAFWRWRTGRPLELRVVEPPPPPPTVPAPGGAAHE